MAFITLSNKVTGSIVGPRNELKNKLQRKAAPRIRRKINQIRSRLLKQAVRLFKEALNQSEIIEALKGFNEGSETGDDLVAEFGLTNTQGRIAAKAIIDTFDESFFSVRVASDAKPRSLQLKVVISGLDPAKYKPAIKNIPGGSYISPKSQITIPWIEWLIDIPFNVISTRHDIIYDLNTKQISRSRSKRALMIRSQAAYQLSSFIGDRRGDNFIQEVATSREFRTQLTEAMRAVVRRGLTV